MGHKYGQIRSVGNAMTFRHTEALGKWLEEHQWSYFFTFTTRYEMSLKQARTLTERTWKAWKVRVPGCQRMFWVAEEHKKGGYHIHGLLHISRPDTDDPWIKSYSERNEWIGLVDAYQNAAGFGTNAEAFDGWHRNKIETFRGVKAIKYCVKYLTKACSDWDFYVNSQEIDLLLKKANENS